MSMIDRPADPRPGQGRGYPTPGDVLAAYRAGSISWHYAIQYLMTYFGWSQNDAAELLDEGGVSEKPGVTDEPGDDDPNGSGDANGADPSDPGVSPGDYSLVGIVAFLWLLSKVF